MYNSILEQEMKMHELWGLTHNAVITLCDRDLSNHRIKAVISHLLHTSMTEMYFPVGLKNSAQFALGTSPKLWSQS